MTHASIEQLTRSGERAVWLTSDGGWPIRCRTTRWSLVFAAAADGEPARRALELGRARVLALLADVLAQLRREYCVRAAIAGVDGDHRFERIKDFLPCPSAGASDYAECAAALDVSVEAVKQAVTRQRARSTDLVEERLLQSGVREADLPRAKRALCQALALPAPYAGAEHAAL